MSRYFVFALCCMLPAAASYAQTAAASQSQTEQVETGFADIAGHPHTRYSIRLMPVSSFPRLPSAVARELDAKECMIPQTYEARAPENVISGSFEKKGSSDWAALCSIHGTSTLYVFFASDFAHPIALRSQPNTLWLGREWGEDYGSAWGISTRAARLMRPRNQLDHDGIEDTFVERSNMVHYFRDGRWTKVEGNQ